MSDSPFPADPSVVEEFAARSDDRDAIRAAVREVMGPGHVVPGGAAREIAATFGLTSVDALMLQLPDEAATLADPPISDYWVGIVGREAGSGDLVLGGNLEFPGAHLGTTVHGEGFVMTRAFQRGTAIDTLALRRAHPCAHCRQYISEFAASSDLTLIDTLGHRLALSDIYPWPFAPSALGETGAVPGTVNWPDLVADDADPDLLDAGRRSWAPYSACPSAIVVETADGQRFSGATVESVAFNPTMAPLQSALISMRAHGVAPGDIRSARLGTVVGGAVDMSRSTADLLAVVAPDAVLTIVDWRT